MSQDIEYIFPTLDPASSFREVLDKLAATNGVGSDSDYRGRLDALDTLSGAILSGDSGLSQVGGLAFLAGFLRSENLEKQMARELPVMEVLQRFVRQDGRKSLRVVPRGVVCHWIAGNVPLLGMFSWAFSAVLGNRNVIRLSRRQNDFVSPLLSLLADTSEAGHRMAAETVVVSFDRENVDAQHVMSSVANVRIAWGGSEAVESIRSLPCRWDCEDVVFGPRMSMAVVDPIEVNDKILRRLAIDTAYFDQLACSSPQQIFVKGSPGDAGFDGFMDGFAAEFAHQSGVNARHDLDFSETYQIHLDRSQVLLGGGRLWRDQHTDWTVALVDAPSGDIVGANRFVQVVPFQELDSIYPHIPKNIQTVVTLLCDSDLERFSEQAALLGVCRLPRPGEGNHFENPWDGIPLVSRLTRWVVRTDTSIS